jgi:phosphoenolpyruvate carboxylase
MAKPVTAGSRAQARTEMPPSLRADVRLFGDVLGDVLREYGGPDLLADVDRLRSLTIAAHSDDVEAAQRAHDDAAVLVEELPPARAEAVARAFTVYFHLANLAEQQHRVRALAQRAREARSDADPLADALRKASALHGPGQAHALLGRLELHPVVTAHPTEARRRAVVVVIRRIADLLERNDDPRLGAGARADVRRRLAEAVDLLWRTAQLREERPGPLDEVRAAMAAFDEVLFRTVPEVYRRTDSALLGDRAGTAPPRVPAFVRLGSWIGGDRDGNPHVTAAVTEQTLAIQSEHILRALEAACARIGRALTVDAATTAPSPGARRMIEDAAASSPELVKRLATRSPNQPHRLALLVAAERLRATQKRNTGLAYRSAAEFIADLRLLQRSLADAGAPRQAYGELQHLIWQAETFGFHLAELEIRQHSSVHSRALAELRSGGSVSAETNEVLATFRTIRDIQQRFGVDACHHYVVSFTRSAGDIAAVFELARLAVDGEELILDVVPLFETRDDLDRCVHVLEEALALPDVRRRLSATGRRLEVMLGYSDSAKDVGPVSAALALYQAQARLVTWASFHALKLTIFHGRGGALGRGGGPVHRALLAQPPGSVDGRFKITEQGEVVQARYGDPTIAARHLQQVASAVVLGSTPAVRQRVSSAAQPHAQLAATLDEAARDAYHALIRSDGFAEWFAQVTPVEELAGLHIGSRPARRGLHVSSLDDLRAIPWVFAWSQARLNLPGWYGLGAGLAAVGDVDLLHRAYEEWPLLTVLLENAEMSLAKTDRRIAVRYLALGGRDDLSALVLAEHARTVEWLLAVTGQNRLLENRPVLGRAVSLRNPYVDALSHLQLWALRELRAEPDDSRAATLRTVLLLTVNGIAAGLQNTG